MLVFTAKYNAFRVLRPVHRGIGDNLAKSECLRVPFNSRVAVVHRESNVVEVAIETC